MYENRVSRIESAHMFGGNRYGTDHPIVCAVQSPLLSAGWQLRALLLFDTSGEINRNESVVKINPSVFFMVFLPI